MKIATMMVALVAAIASLAAVGNAFVMPPAGVAGRNAGHQALTPATSQPAPSRSSGASAVGALNVKIVLGEEENVEAALMRFRRTVSRSGHLQELRWKRHFETNAERKKRKVKENKRKERIQRTRERRAKEMQF
ncbi:unnamed protein product [Ectocarpus sp. 12 AP-2014]